jgi:large subunit ribosomal protein L10
MAKEQKTKIIDQVAEEFAKSKIIVVTDFRGLTAKELTNLRRQMRKSESGYQVVKNTLAIRAAAKAGKEDLQKLLGGPAAMAYGYSDPSRTVKTILDHIRASTSALQIKGALLGDRLLSKEEVMFLATLPSREVLLARLAGQLMSPLQRLHYVLSSPLRGLAYVLQARVKQMEAMPAAAPAAPVVSPETNAPPAAEAPAAAL